MEFWEVEFELELVQAYLEKLRYFEGVGASVACKEGGQIVAEGGVVKQRSEIKAASGDCGQAREDEDGRRDAKSRASLRAQARSRHDTPFLTWGAGA